MKKSFKSLELNKKTIAKLNNDQLGSVKGGKQASCFRGVTCRDGGITVVTGNEQQ